MPADGTGPARENAVLLWPDTFNNHFHPETAIAAVELLESAGFVVTIPRSTVCCGRPLYDYGLLPLAKRMLERLLETVRKEIRAGLPVVVLEPSCAAVFHDELPNLLPHDEDGKRLERQVFLLGQFVQQHRDRFTLPALDARILFHPHCHQKAVFGTAGDRALLQSIAAAIDAPDTGCCGMAGSFGFEADHYDISMKVGERVLLPAVRGAGRDTIVLADGFSCREQIAQATGRQALHLAQVLRLAQANGSRPGELPERAQVIDHAAETADRLPAYAAAFLVGLGAILGFRGFRGSGGSGVQGVQGFKGSRVQRFRGSEVSG